MNIAMGWFGKSVIAGLLFVVPFLSINFFIRNFQLKPEVILFWYLVGTELGCFGGAILLKIVRLSEFSLSVPLAVVVALGVIFGSSSNILLYQAIAGSPNPAMPVAIININTAIAFFAAIGLAAILPKWFDVGKFGFMQFCGIVLIVLGVVLLSLKR